ncbi:MAG: hypothetical protein JO021_22570 [Alphaproteobacteria bacterium]|nr:hypothetical protein [Alphaproteobacteria bacterium]
MLTLTPPTGALDHAEPDVSLGGRTDGSRARLRPPGSADASTAAWILELPPDAEAFVKPLDGWIGARVRLGGGQLDFATRAEAETFALRHGWRIDCDAVTDTGRVQ